MTPATLIARVIAAELELMYQVDVLAFLTRKNSRRRFAEGRISMSDERRPGKPLVNGLSEAIGCMLKKKPFILCKVLCRHFHIGKASCLRLLRNVLRLKKFNLCWVSPDLGKKQQVQRPTFHANFLWCDSAIVLLISKI
jgi:hypothetical protein